MSWGTQFLLSIYLCSSCFGVQTWMRCLVSRCFCIDILFFLLPSSSPSFQAWPNRSSLLHYKINLPCLWLISRWSHLARLASRSFWFRAANNGDGATREAAGDLWIIPFAFPPLSASFFKCRSSAQPYMKLEMLVSWRPTWRTGKTHIHQDIGYKCKSNSSFYSRIKMLIVDSKQTIGKDSNCVHARNHGNSFSPEERGRWGN